ncbi:MAG TPA: hypothetical protein VG889_08195 [Rhizomicrobium sp.]|nr:hypothetical protein [Rhizomicrobium sp.]
MSKKRIRCAVHGEGDTVFVCDHTLKSLRDNAPRGLYQWQNEDGNVNAWCDECNARMERSAANGNPVPLKFNIETLCPVCFEGIRRLNGGGHLYK